MQQMKTLFTSRQLLDEKLSTIQSYWQKILPYWIAAAITALVSVIYAKGFGWSEELAFQWVRQEPLLAFVITPLALVGSMEMARRLSPLSSGSGIPQLIVAVEAARTSPDLLSRVVGWIVIPIKFLGSCLCVAGGGISGREGPMLQISACIFNGVERIWKKTGLKLDPQSMILAGGAAGLASAFNTPLGGIIFAIEELAKIHISVVRTSIFHSVVLAGVLAQAFLGNYLYFGKIQISSIQYFEWLPLAVAAALIGISGALFGAWIVRANDWRQSLSVRMKISMTLTCGLLAATLIYFVGVHAIGSGRSVILDLLSHPDLSSDSLILALARLFGNYFTYVGGVIGGIFAPSLSTGAAFGLWMSHMIPEANPQVWILAGMVAFLTGVTRTPFTSLILVLEMTDSHAVILPLMLVAILAQGAAKLVDPISFYEHMAHRILKAHSSPNEPNPA